MKKALGALSGVVIAAALAGGPAAAGEPVTILAKTGISYETRAADLKRCEDSAANADERDLPPSDRPVGYGAGYAGGGGGGVGAVLGVAIAQLIIGAMERSEARGRGTELCMRNLGYRALPLTADEAHVYTKLAGAKKLAWQKTFLTGDVTARMAPLIEPQVPRLPAYTDAPMRIGGLQFADLVLAAPEAKAGEIVVTGTLTRARTAVLVTPIETADGPVRVAADPGTVFHQVDYRRQKDPLLRLDGATWCAPVFQVSNGIRAKDFYCFVGRDEGYEVFRPSGQPWLAGPYLGGFSLPLYKTPIKLEERASDDLGPLDFRVEVKEITSRHVLLAGVVKGKVKSVTLWLREFEWEKAAGAAKNAKTDTAELPLWDHKLVLTRVGDGKVTAELVPGDGSDWRYAGNSLY